MKRTLTILALFLFVFVCCLLIGCTYTAPSVSEPDLVEKITNGHKVCYYKTGPGRGYAKCCEDCPMHENQTLTTNGGKP